MFFSIYVYVFQFQAKKKELVDIIVNRISEAVYKDDRAPLSRRVSARRRTALLLAGMKCLFCIILEFCRSKLLIAPTKN